MEAVNKNVAGKSRRSAKAPGMEGINMMKIYEVLYGRNGDSQGHIGYFLKYTDAYRAAKEDFDTCCKHDNRYNVFILENEIDESYASLDEILDDVDEYITHEWVTIYEI